MVAPKGPGTSCVAPIGGWRRAALVAVQQDATGHAHDIALAYAHGIGATRAGARDDLYRRDRDRPLWRAGVLCGGVSALVRAGYETLVEAATSPRVPIRVLHELKLIVDLMYEEGITGMRFSVSDTAEYGDLTRAHASSTNR